MSETDVERIGRATELLEEKVRRETLVDSRLDNHEARLATINGQFERGAKATEVLAERITNLHGTINNLCVDFHTKQEVDEALRERANEIVKNQITRREFWLGVAVLVVTILSVAVQAGLL